jgi:hypothetical protein
MTGQGLREIGKQVVLQSLREQYLKTCERLQSNPEQPARFAVSELDNALAYKVHPPIPKWLRYNLLRELLWELVRQGLIYPYHIGDTVENWSIWFTERGTDAICNESSPSHPRFLRGLVELEISDTALIYLEEAMQCSASPTAVVMMAGVATEALIIDLINAYCAFLTHEGLQATKLQKQVISPATTVSDKIRTFVADVEERWRSFCTGIDAPVAQIQALQVAIAQNRNAAGHPTGVRFRTEEAEAQMNMVRVQGRRILEWMREIKTLSATTPKGPKDA